MNNNIFIYWIGNEYKLIMILRNLIYLHNKQYNIHFINDDNVHQYINDIPPKYNTLIPALKADYIRVNVICDYGGIWLDSDTIIMDSLDSLFDIFKKNDNNNKDGFLIRENNDLICNGIFGSKKNTLLMKSWKKKINTILHKKSNIEWNDIGSNILNFQINKTYLDTYHIFNGLDNLYPINWTHCVNNFIDRPYDNYKEITRDYQPLIILVNTVYKALENYTIKKILNSKMPINYFINKSFQNLNLVNYDFIEIGSGDFNFINYKNFNKYHNINNNDNYNNCMYIEPIKDYIDKLPDSYDNYSITKLNLAISDNNNDGYIYYVPENIIINDELPLWMKGCNSLNKYHKMHLKYDILDKCKKDAVNIITLKDLFINNNVGKLCLLKLKTEGHSSIILNSFYEYLQYLPIDYYPHKIIFDSNQNSDINDINHTIKLYSNLNYIASYQDTITTLILK
jgi:hypothetical protein